MKTKLLGLLAFVYLGAAAAASASPITYKLIDATATSPLGTDTLSGTFTFTPDGPDSILDAVRITVTGPVAPGVYDIPFPATGYSAAINVAPYPYLSVGFFAALGDVPDPLTRVTIEYADFVSSTVTGYADPVTPLPAALPLFGSVLGIGGLFGWFRKRKASTAVAA
jgi:hypothetical protein